MDLNPELHRITRNEVPEAGICLVNAFLQDPFAQCLIPHGPDRRKHLRDLFRFMARYGMHYGHVFSTSQKTRDISIWYHSDYLKVNFFKAFRSGYFNFLFKAPPYLAQRFKQLAKEVGKYHSELIDVPHIYLNVLGVAPEYQNRGRGSAHLKKVLDIVNEQQLSCYLESFNEKNLEFYKRFGFQVLKEFRVLGKQVWGMKKLPE
ncbi:MAG: GNAT family N-acetyltransferase [Spirochaetota bacterium]